MTPKDLGAAPPIALRWPLLAGNHWGREDGEKRGEVGRMVT